MVYEVSSSVASSRSHSKIALHTWMFRQDSSTSGHDFLNSVIINVASLSNSSSISRAGHWRCRRTAVRKRLHVLLTSIVHSAQESLPHIRVSSKEIMA